MRKMDEGFGQREKEEELRQGEVWYDDFGWNRDGKRSYVAYLTLLLLYMYDSYFFFISFPFLLFFHEIIQGLSLLL